MILTRKRTIRSNQIENANEFQYLYHKFQNELEKSQKELNNLTYQKDFFGDSPEIRKKQADFNQYCDWLNNQITDFKNLYLEACN